MKLIVAKTIMKGEETLEIARLGPEQRMRAIHQMSEQTFDVIVIGGGVTGAGTALDAASRGLMVALLEAKDLASGTSSRSGKTLHGGLRYLQQLNFSLVRQAAYERNLMVNCTPLRSDRRKATIRATSSPPSHEKRGSTRDAITAQ